MDLQDKIRSVPDFPVRGVLFRDITPLLQDSAYLKESVRLLSEKLAGFTCRYVAGPESRGFIFAVPLAVQTGKGFIPVRKAGKLPYETIKKSYALEYGEATIEIHADALKPGDRVVVVDDLLATGGTCRAVCELIEAAGGRVEAALFLIELEALGGRKNLEKYHVESILTY